MQPRPKERQGLSLIMPVTQTRLGRVGIAERAARWTSIARNGRPSVGHNAQFVPTERQPITNSEIIGSTSAVMSMMQGSWGTLEHDYLRARLEKTTIPGVFIRNSSRIFVWSSFRACLHLL